MEDKDIDDGDLDGNGKNQEPAQKWLKDRKGRTLAADDVLHYKSVILALIETMKLTARL